MHKVIKIIAFFLVMCVNEVEAQRVTVRFIDIDRGKGIFSLHVNDSLQARAAVERFVMGRRRRGFLEASADSIVFNQREWNVFVHIGPQYFLDTLLIVCDRDTTVMSWRRQKFFPKILEVETDRYLRALRNSGYPFVRVTGKDCRLEGFCFVCTVTVDKGGFYVFDTLVVNDSVKINRRFLENYLSLTPGKPFSYEALSQLSGRISALGYLQLRDTLQVEFYPGLARPVLSLQKTKINTAEALVGVRYENGRLEGVGHLSMHVRALVQAEDFSFSWQRPRPAWQQVDMSLQVPYVLSLPLGVHFDYFAQKIDTLQFNLRVGVGVSYFFQGMNSLTFLWKTEKNFTTQHTQSEKTVIKRLGQVLFTVDYMKSRGFALRGWSGQAAISYGKKILPDSLYWSVNYSARLEGAWAPTKHFTLFCSVRSVAIISPMIFDNEVMHVGGYGDFLGFNEQQFAATSYSLLTLEPRWYVASAYLFVFAQKGLIHTRTVSQDSTVRTAAFGFGINLALENAKLGITYAVGTTDRSLSLSSSKIHLSYKLLF